MKPFSEERVEHACADSSRVGQSAARSRCACRSAPEEPRRPRPARDLGVRGSGSLHLRALAPRHLRRRRSVARSRASIAIGLINLEFVKEMVHQGSPSESTRADDGRPARWSARPGGSSVPPSCATARRPRPSRVRRGEAVRALAQTFREGAAADRLEPVSRPPGSGHAARFNAHM
jgi:hypothetical protein